MRGTVLPFPVIYSCVKEWCTLVNNMMNRRRPLWKRICCAVVLWSAPILVQASEVRELIVGPVHLDARTMARHHLPAGEQVIQFTEDMWLISIESHLIDAAGNSLPSQLLCHTNLFDAPENLLPDNLRPYLAWSSDMSPVQFPEGTGVPIHAGRPYRWVTFFQNPFPQGYRDVYLQVKLTLEPMRTEPQRQSLQQAMLCVAGCSHHGYLAPPGRSVKQTEVRFPLAGRMVLMLSHLHQYGQRLILEKVHEGEAPSLIWEAKPERRSGAGFRMPEWVSAPGLLVSPSDQFRLSAEYDNPTEQDWPAMGMIFAFILPSPPSSETH